MKERLFIISQYLLPHHLLSRLAGCIAECRVHWFKNVFTSWFAKRYQVNMSEALVEDVTAYEHFNAFFTRALKPGARPLDETPGAILCPADGTVSQLGLISVLFGAGTPSLAVAGWVLLLAHAAFKAALFMVVGIIDHQSGTRDIRELPPLEAGWLPVKIVTILAAPCARALASLACSMVACPSRSDGIRCRGTGT